MIASRSLRAQASARRKRNARISSRVIAHRLPALTAVSARLPALKDRVAALERRSQSLLGVLGLAADLAGATLVAQRLLDAEHGVLADVLLGEADRDGRSGGEPPSIVERGRHELVGLDEGIQQAQAI